MPVRSRTSGVSGSRMNSSIDEPRSVSTNASRNVAA